MSASSGEESRPVCRRVATCQPPGIELIHNYCICNNCILGKTE